jgi:hypothetical protein
MARLDLTLLGLLADAGACPEDPAPRLVLADYLTDLPPGPVLLAELPGWLRLAWSRSCRGDRASRTLSATRWGALSVMEEWMRARGLDHVWRFDHHGKTLVGGLPCFASEPYAPLEQARRQADALAARVGCPAVALPEGSWGKGTRRVLLLPTPKLLPKAFRFLNRPEKGQE